MSKYVRRPVTVDAWQITADTFEADHPNPEHQRGVTYNPLNHTVFVQTAEGTMRAGIGDWIVRGIAGELYPVKGALFAHLYRKPRIHSWVFEYFIPIAGGASIGFLVMLIAIGVLRAS